MSSQTTIEDLDDYCLEYIFEFLPLIDKVNIGKISGRFNAIIEHLIENLQVNFNEIYETLTFEIAKEIFEKYGPVIKKIFMQFDAVEEMVEFYYLVPRNCPNIEEILYNFPYYVDNEIMEMMFNASKNIRVLRCNARELMDLHCLHISKLHKLEVLSIEVNRDVTGLHLSKCTKLKDLNIQGCSDFQPNHFIEICAATKLKNLNIVECELLDGDCFETLLKTQSDLESIGISHCYRSGDVEVLAQLKDLQHIRIEYLCQRPHKNTNLLKQLAQHRHSSMRTLAIIRPEDLSETERKSILKLTNLHEIVFIADKALNNGFLSELSKSCTKLRSVDISECDNVTNEGIIELVTNLQGLTHLDLRRCGQFNETLFHKLVEIKKKSGDDQRLKVYVWGTQLQPHLLGQLEGYTQGKKYVELSFRFKY